MKKILAISLGLVLSFLLVFGCKKSNDSVYPGNTLYVDIVKGDDSLGEGSKISPFRTISRALDSLQSGDILLLNNGNYGDVVVGRTPGENWGSDPSDITVPYSKFNNWVTIKAAPGQTPHFNSLSIGTLNIPNSGSPAKEIDFSQKGNCDLYMSFEDLVIEDGVSIMGSRYVKIKGCTINRSGELVGSVSIIDNKTGIEIENGRYITIEDNDITHVAIGIAAASYDLTIKSNDIHLNSHDGIRVLGGENWLIEDNKIHDIDDGVDDDSGEEWNRHVDGIQIFTMYEVTNNLRVRGNIIYHIEAMGVMVNESTSGRKYENWIFENNIFGPVGSIVLHFGADVEKGCVYRHNTVVYAPNDTWQSLYRTLNYQQYHVAMWGAGETNNGYRYYNNIFTSDSEVPDDYDFFAGNIYYDPEGKIACPYEAIPGSISDYIASGKLPGTLTSNSAAINAGATKYTSELSTDFMGNARDSKPDIGALEKK
jgi:hypothetical protein